MPSEVFAWPEGEVRLYPSGTASAVALFVENVDFVKKWEWTRVPLFGGTGAGYERYHLRNLQVEVTIGQLYHDMAIWSMANSATAFSLDLHHSSVAGNSAGFHANSARIREWSLKGGNGQVFVSTVQLVMADVSAYGTGI